jgi:hypothetical protein
VIGKVIRGARVGGLTRYLFGPGERNEHVDPHVVAGFRHPAALEPGMRPDGSRDVSNLNGLLNLPLAVLPPGTGVDKPVWHCVLRAAPEDPELSDDAWAAITHEVMNHVGLARYGDDGGVHWVAVRHANDHVHIVATLAREDGRKPPLSNDFYRVREACNRVERRYGLRSTAPGDRTAARRPTRAETEQARRQDMSEEPRVTLRRQVAAVAAMADNEAAFFARLRADGLLVRERFSRRDPGEVTGYAVALPGHVNRHGRTVWFGGGRLAADLTLPKLRHRWASPAATHHNFVARDAAWAEAISAATHATDRLRSCRLGSPAAADIAWATTDVLRATARRLDGGPYGLLRRAADAYDRAARAPYGRIPISTAGSGLRAAARIIAQTSTDDDRMSRAVATLLGQLATLADTVAHLRAAQRRTAQALAAAETAALLRPACQHADRRHLQPERARDAAGEADKTVAAPVAIAARDFPNPPVAGHERLHPVPRPIPVRHPDRPHRSRR